MNLWAKRILFFVFVIACIWLFVQFIKSLSPYEDIKDNKAHVFYSFQTPDFVENKNGVTQSYFIDFYFTDDNGDDLEESNIEIQGQPNNVFTKIDNSTLQLNLSKAKKEGVSDLSFFLKFLPGAQEKKYTISINKIMVMYDGNMIPSTVNTKRKTISTNEFNYKNTRGIEDFQSHYNYKGLPANPLIKILVFCGVFGLVLLVVFLKLRSNSRRNRMFGAGELNFIYPDKPSISLDKLEEFQLGEYLGMPKDLVLKSFRNEDGKLAKMEWNDSSVKIFITPLGGTSQLASFGCYLYDNDEIKIIIDGVSDNYRLTYFNNLNQRL
tara:strand:+ start:288 stop:1256 length:969 start_codon:yes stop_codon:yes gene_type:complete